MHKKESVTWKIGHWKLPRKRSKKKERLKKSEETLWELWDTGKETIFTL